MKQVVWGVKFSQVFGDIFVDGCRESPVLPHIAGDHHDMVSFLKGTI